jgi:hypothetical protein
MSMRRVLVAAIVASLTPALAPAQVVRGSVVDSASGKPIAKAEVTLPDVGRGTATDDQGTFELRDVPAGTQRVLVRHIGYGPIELRLTFVAGQTLERRVMMVRSTTLDSVVVKGQSVDHALDDFEVNRRLGLGHFLTRAELAPQEGRTLGSVLTTMPGIKVHQRGPYAWLGSGRAAHSTSFMAGVALDPSDVPKAAPVWDCYPLVYMDNQLVWRGLKYRNPPGAPGPQYTLEPLFDVNSIQVGSVEAIEYYAGAAETPAKYATLNSECGVLVIHMLRFHPQDTTTAATKPPAHDLIP